MNQTSPQTAASYARMSTEDHRRLAEQHAANALRSLDDGYVIPGEYRFGECGSGMDADPPALQRLLQVIEDGGGPDRIYVTDLRRLSRSHEGCSDLLDRFARAGVEVGVPDLRGGSGWRLEPILFEAPVHVSG